MKALKYFSLFKENIFNLFCIITYYDIEDNVLPRRYDFNYSTGGNFYGRFKKRLPARKRYV